jgi:NarL family two-component system response regulator LiaR
MPNTSATDVIILTPTARYRAAWHALLDRQPDITGAGLAAAPAELTSVRVTQALAALFLDVPTPHLDLIRQCRAVAPAFKLLVLVESFELATLLPLLQAGVMGCVARDDTVGNLARAVTAVGRGKLVLPSTIAARALASLASGESGLDASIMSLSEREAEVLRLLATGLTNKDIAQSLILSVRTVEAHLRSIFVKINVHSRTEAVLCAVRHTYEPAAIGDSA